MKHREVSGWTLTTTFFYRNSLFQQTLRVNYVLALQASSTILVHGTSSCYGIMCANSFYNSTKQKKVTDGRALRLIVYINELQMCTVTLAFQQDSFKRHVVFVWQSFVPCHLKIQQGITILWHGQETVNGRTVKRTERQTMKTIR